MRIGFCAQSLRETGKRTTPTTRDSCCVSESVRSNDRIVPYSKASPPVQSATPPQKQEQRTPEIRIGIPGHVHNVRSQPRYVIHKYRSTPGLGNEFGPFAASTRWAQVWKLFCVLCPHLRGCQCSYSKTIDFRHGRWASASWVLASRLSAFSIGYISRFSFNLESLMSFVR